MSDQQNDSQQFDTDALIDNPITLKITQASLNQTALDWPRNMANIYAAIDEAVKQGSDILALEELALTGYEANDEFQRTDNRRILASLRDIAAYAQAYDPDLIISIGHPWRLQMRDLAESYAIPGAEFEKVKDPLYDRLNLPFNVQSIISGGRIHGMTAKTNLYNDGRGYEKRYFNEWSVAGADRVGGTYGTIPVPLTPDLQPEDTLFGRPILQFTNGEKRFNLAQAICEEKWVATRYDGFPADDSRYLTDNIIPSIADSIDATEGMGLVLLLPNASPPSRDKIDMHIHLAKMASEHADVVIDTDGLGSSGSTFAQFGHRLVVQDGQVKGYGTRMNFARVATTTTVVQVENANLPQNDNIHAVISRNFKEHADAPAVAATYPAWDNPANPDRHFEEVIRYTAFWLYDYMRKTGSRGVMEALSGGADSAFNSVMVSVMAHMAVKELGVAQFAADMNLKNAEQLVAIEKTFGADAAIEVCLDDMLTGVYMGTNNSSAETRNAAQFLMQGGMLPSGEMVKGIGGKFLNRNVQDLLDFYGTMYAIEDTTAFDSNTKAELMRDVAAYLNASPHTTSDEERAEMAEKLKGKYPQITDLVTAADGVAYENIQARGREVLIMLFANKEGKMAVANPNLDEARNAYATFGGDLHSGTINLNAHLPKAYQLQIMQYLFENGVQGVMDPVRSLGPILKNKPTAELQPKDAEGKVVQHDEDALQRSFDQMNFISATMLYTRTRNSDIEGDRRLNAVEVFNTAQASPLFDGVDDNTLYNMVRLSYQRWTIAQHKIHASPIAPTYGSNVDHQTSQRTPNIHGQSKDELAQLGVALMANWAAKDGTPFSDAELATLERRTWQDESFIKRFDLLIYSGQPGQDYNLARVYEQVKAKGLDGVFPPLPETHPIRVLERGLKVA